MRTHENDHGAFLLVLGVRTLLLSKEPFKKSILGYMPSSSSSSCSLSSFLISNALALALALAGAVHLSQDKIHVHVPFAHRFRSLESLEYHFASRDHSLVVRQEQKRNVERNRTRSLKSEAQRHWFTDDDRLTSFASLTWDTERRNEHARTQRTARSKTGFETVINYAFDLLHSKRTKMPHKPRLGPYFSRFLLLSFVVCRSAYENMKCVFKDDWAA